jgi:hypothetical protein
MSKKAEYRSSAAVDCAAQTDLARLADFSKDDRTAVFMDARVAPARYCLSLASLAAGRRRDPSCSIEGYCRGCRDGTHRGWPGATPCRPNLPARGPLLPNPGHQHIPIPRRLRAPRDAWFLHLLIPPGPLSTDLAQAADGLG